MKTKLFLISALLLIAIMGFIFSNLKTSSPADNTSTVSSVTPPPPVKNRWLEKFYVGAVDCEIDFHENYSHLNLLGFNLWHNFSSSESDQIQGKKTPFVDWYDQTNLGNNKLITQVSGYSQYLNPKISSIYNSPTDGSKRNLIMSRPKFEWLCYGQRSDYQCEPVNPDADLWFYAFNDHETGVSETDNSVYGGGASVMHCRTTPTNPTRDNPGYAVKRLRANTEQCRDESTGIPWQGDAQCDWYIKPRIRIPKDFPANNQETPICKITVIQQNGSTILKEVVLTGKYFGNNNNPYDGYYKEDGFYFPSIDSTLTVSTNWGTSWGYSARGIRPENYPGMNHADIQVYWYGNCDMWIDYVRVDNDVASDLLSTDPLNAKHVQYINWVNQEVALIENPTNPAIMRYYLELVEFNNLPCIHYVDSIIKAKSSGRAEIMQNYYSSIAAHVSLERITTITNPDFLKRNYIEKAGYSEIFAECYPFTACHTTNPDEQSYSKIPNTLPVHDGAGNKILGKAVSPAEYETWLQEKLFYKPSVMEGYEGDKVCGNPIVISESIGWFRYIMQTCNSISKQANVPFIFMPQVHQNYEPGEVEREPTNEEINMTVNVAVSYGARGILYFGYPSWSISTGYVKGIAEEDGSLRTLNVYQQVIPQNKKVL